MIFIFLLFFINIISDSIKFVLPKFIDLSNPRMSQEVRKIGSFFNTLKEKIERLETTHYKTAMILFFDLIKKLENDIFPSKLEINDASLKATEAFNFLNDDDLDEKIKMSKIRLFCKSYEVLFDEETNTFRTFEFLKSNERNFLREFINSEIARLEEISKGMTTISPLTGRKRLSSSLEKYKRFVDDIDQIKRLSYSSIKKEDYAFEHNGKISKYWTLTKNMVPEGHEDSLQALDCSFKDSSSKEITISFRVYSNLANIWMVEIESSEPFTPLKPVTLCAVERDSTSAAVPCVYFPKRQHDSTDENKKKWSLEMQHLNYPNKEVTLIFSFVGTMEENLDTALENYKGSVLKTVVEKDMGLIFHMNEFPHESTTFTAVSMGLVVSNFLKNSLIVKDPYLTSGTLDESKPWARYIRPSSSSFLFTRKKAIEARGSVGLTVITVQNGLRLFSFVVHWNAPFDFNLYKNSFAIFPLPGQHYNSSQDVTSIFKSFIDYSNINKVDDKFVGIRGYAKDGPKAMEFCGMLISAKMGVKHHDFLQISVLPLGQTMQDNDG